MPGCGAVPTSIESSSPRRARHFASGPATSAEGDAAVTTPRPGNRGVLVATRQPVHEYRGTGELCGKLETFVERVAIPRYS
jgi:hypothetical protein